MLQLLFKPELHYFDTCREFAERFRITADDLVLTNKYIYEPFFGPLDLPAMTLYQEEFGSGEPSDVMVNAILEAMETKAVRRVIAVGGGTIIDIAKVLAVAPTGERVDDLFRDMGNLQSRRELVILPTTCGTGSEVTNISILNRTSMGTKMGLVSPSMFASQAVLVPELLSTLPYGVFATSSIDALVHAVESALSPKATPYTRIFSDKAMQLILRGYQRVRQEGPQARVPLMKDFLIASNFAGLAFGTAGCAAVHALSYPLGGSFHVPHGESNYALFVAVLKAYRRVRSDGALAELESFLASELSCEPEEAFDALGELLAAILPLKRLREYGMKEEDIPSFAGNVLASQQRLLANNYVPLSERQIEEIYASRW
ncbi:4-hydroxybutyrate dehydrogenase [Mailhella sp.]|uniref:4-hydroxybutyrate dehydrogenase n=1 Tax=Mailhella sp. TaxID=1981029 RepID=UPI003AB360C2